MSIARLAVMTVCSIGLSVGSVIGAPITYNAELFDGVTESGTINQPNGSPNEPVGAEYFSFYAEAGDNITIEGNRLDVDYDMSLWVFSGLFADTDDFGADFDAGDAPFADFADDELPETGPFGDPQSIFVAPTSGFYTIAVTNFLSDDDPPFDFELTVTGNSTFVPEPASLAMWGVVGASALVWRRRRRSTEV